MNMFKYYKVNIINGCRLSDINKNVVQDQVFYLNSHVAVNSRSVDAAVRNKWLIEITEKEASKYITLPTKELVMSAPPVVDKTPPSRPIVSIDDKKNEGALKRVQARLEKMQNDESEILVNENNQSSLEPEYSSDAEQRVAQRVQRVKKLSTKQSQYEKENQSIETEAVKLRQQMAEKYLQNKNNSELKTDRLIVKDIEKPEQDTVKNQIYNEITNKINEKIDQLKNKEKEQSDLKKEESKLVSDFKSDPETTSESKVESGKKVTKKRKTKSKSKKNETKIKPEIETSNESVDKPKKCGQKKKQITKS